MHKLDCVINKNAIAGGSGKTRDFTSTFQNKNGTLRERAKEICNLWLGRFKKHDQTDLCLNWGLNNLQPD